MIKKSVFENDLIFGMQRELQAYDKKVAMANLDKAGDYLQAAIEIFEEAGLNVQADQVLSILEKIATKPSIQEMPNLQVFFNSGKFTPEELKAAFAGDTLALAKVNVGLHEHGMSDQKIKDLLGENNYMPHSVAKNLMKKTHVSGLQNWMKPSPAPGQEIVVSPLPSVKDPESDEMGEQEIVMKSLLASAADELEARHKSHKPKNPFKIHDPHTQGLTPERMVENLKHHGIVFNMADDGKANDLLDVDLSDDNDLEVYEEDPKHKSFEDES